MEDFKPFMGYAKTYKNVPLSSYTDVAEPESDNADDIHDGSQVSTNTNSERQNTESPAAQPVTASLTSFSERQSSSYLNRNRKATPETCNSSVGKK
jgi:hypothetical protein